jgi:hypothetical protein
MRQPDDNQSPETSFVATAVESVTGMATGKPAASDEPESIVEAALPDLSQVPSADLPPVQVATANPSDLVPNDAKGRPEIEAYE